MVVWLAEYPRCGVTFLRTVLMNCFGLPTYSVYREFEPCDFPHRQWPEEANGEPVSFIKTHYPMIFPESIGRGSRTEPEGDKAVFLARDGRDAIVSWYSMRKRWGTADDGMLAKAIAKPGFASCVEYWLNRPCVIVYFEALIREPIGVVNAMLAALGMKAKRTGNEPPNFEQLKRKDPSFFYSGRVGRWRKELPSDLEELWWKHNGRAMERLGYDRFANGERT